MTKAKGSRKTSTVAPSVVALAAAFFLVLLVTNAQFVMNVQAQLEFESEAEKQATITLIQCGSGNSYEAGTELWFWTELECMHDMLYLKGLPGICPTHEFCEEVNEYVNSKDIANEPIPQDTWCNTNNDVCIQKTEAEKQMMTDAAEGTDVDISNLIGSFDKTIEELEEKKEAQTQDQEE